MPLSRIPSLIRMNVAAANQNPAEDALVQVRGLRTRIGTKTIFDGLDLDVPRGSITAVMGPSGTGKTTLLRHLTGQLRPDAGHVIVDGEEVTTLSRGALFGLRERIGFLFQNSALLTDFSVFENVAFPLRQHAKLPEELLRNIVLTKLQAVGLRGAAQLMPSELSGGMARRVALARAIVFDPMLILITSILVAHELAAIRQVADRVYLIANGKLVAQGAPDELAHQDSPWTRQFFGGEADGPVPFQYPAPDYATELGFVGTRR